MKQKRNLSIRYGAVLLSVATLAMLGGSTLAKTTARKTTKAKPTPPTSDTIKTKDGLLRITPKFHGSFQLEFAGRILEIDPVSAASYTRKADYILITHPHPDHFDLAAIKKLIHKDNNYIEPEPTDTVTTTSSGPVTTIVAPASIIKQLRSAIKTAALNPLGNGDNYIMKPGQVFSAEITTEREDADEETIDLRAEPEVSIDAVPMYNVVRERKKGEKYHPKGVGNGYILTLGGKRIYIAGDTEATPEMKKLKNIDIAFLPMNLPYTMTPQEAAKGARAFKPKIVYPYHYRSPFNKVNTNAHQFAAALKGTGIQVRVREWYPEAAVARATAAAKK